MSESPLERSAGAPGRLSVSPRDSSDAICCATPPSVPEHSPDDLKCLLCGEPLEPPLVHPSFVVERVNGPDELTQNTFLVHERCLRNAAHPALLARVRERLDQP